MGAWALITLDLATCTGWTDGWSEPGLPDHGYLELTPVQDGDRGPAFHELRTWLIRRVEKHQARGRRVIVAFEQPILPKPFLKDGRIIYPTNINVTLLLQGLAAIVEEVCYATGAECGYVEVQTVKKALAGTGKAEKVDMVFVATKMGFTIERHDTADAVGIGLAALPMIDRNLADRWIARAWAGRGSLL